MRADVLDFFGAVPSAEGTTRSQRFRIEGFSRALPVALDGKPALTVPRIVAETRGSSETPPTTELRLDVTGLADAEVPTVSLNSHRLERPAGSEVVGEVRRFEKTSCSLPRRTWNPPPTIGRTLTNLRGCIKAFSSLLSGNVLANIDKNSVPTRLRCRDTRTGDCDEQHAKHLPY